MLKIFHCDGRYSDIARKSLGMINTYNRIQMCQLQRSRNVQAASLAHLNVECYQLHLCF